MVLGNRGKSGSALTSIDDVLALDNRQMIAAAYRRLLGREVDPEGESYYLGRLEAGVPRLRILKQINDSEEAKSYDREWPELERMLENLPTDWLKGLRGFRDRYGLGGRSSSILYMSDFLDYFDEDLVTVCFRNILRREPDAGGMNFYVQRLRAGVSRTRIVATIYDGKEACRLGSRPHIVGLGSARIANALIRIPVLGRLVEMVLFVATFPTFVRDQRALQNHVYRLTKMGSENNWSGPK